MKSNFSFSRFLLLLKTEIINPYSRRIYFNIGIIIIAINLFSLCFSRPVPIELFSSISAFLIIFAPCFFYLKLYNRINSVPYMMTPGNPEEKFLSAWVHLCLVFPLFILLLTSVFKIIQVLLGFGDFTEFFGGFGKEYITTISGQAVFFWACFWFKKNKIGKLVLLFCSIALAFVLLGELSAVLYWQIFSEIAWNNHPSSFFGYWIFPYKYYSEILLFIIFPISLWLLSLYKFKRQQI